MAFPPRLNWEKVGTGPRRWRSARLTAGLIVADPHAMPYFGAPERNLDDINDVFDPLITTGEVIALPFP